MIRPFKAVCLVMCAALMLTSLPLSSFAAAVDKKTAADPNAVLRNLDKMNLAPMPDALADALQGEYLSAGAIAYYAWVIYGIPLLNSTALYIATRWKPGTIGALGNILATHYGCGHCTGGGGSW